MRDFLNLDVSKEDAKANSVRRKTMVYAEMQKNPTTSRRSRLGIRQPQILRDGTPNPQGMMMHCKQNDGKKDWYRYFSCRAGKILVIVLSVTKGMLIKDVCTVVVKK